uniref:Peptidase S1 domain-containing protein n=1 Tax=Acrobeloides nanus TaxID=290746 RepID=A0A914C5I8_9BILA
MLGLAKSTFFLLFSASLVWVGIGQQCGSRPGFTSSFSNDVVGGCYAGQGEYPWEGLIQFFNGGVLNETCGLTLISSSYALTSARCINISLETYFNNVTILLGAVNISDPSGVITTINQSFIHPEYNVNPLNHNIAIIKLNINLNFTNNNKIQPICLPAVDKSLIYQPSVVAGWGFYSFDNYTCTNANYVNATTINYQNSTAWSLVKATVPVIGNELCQLYYPEEANVTFTNATICAGTDTKGAMGHGDRGTPLMIANNGTWFQTGVFSAHFYNTNVHEALAQRLYSRVSSYCDWINSTTNGEAQCTNVDLPTPAPSKETSKGLAPSNYASFAPLLIFCVLLVSNLF